MLIKECMTKNVKLGNPNMTLLEAAKKMRDGNFGALPIGENDRLVGMLTDRDIAIRAVAEGLDPQKIKVRDVMSQKVFYCYEDQTSDEVTRTLANHQIRRLPVLNRQKRLVGILSLSDLAQSDARPELVENVLKRSTSSRFESSSTH